MNIYEIETIALEEAQKSAAGTRYDWKDLVSFESLNDLKRALKSRRASREEYREEFRRYFEDLLLDLEAEDA